jgi:hypothetical protein
MKKQYTKEQKVIRKLALWIVDHDQTEEGTASYNSMRKALRSAEIALGVK